jgi:hypothetical protein
MGHAVRLTVLRTARLLRNQAAAQQAFLGVGHHLSNPAEERVHDATVACKYMYRTECER